MMCIFLAALSLKWKVICRLSSMLYFNQINLWRLLAPLQEEIDIYPYGLFWTKFNAEQLLFEGFLDAMRIFSSFEP